MQAKIIQHGKSSNQGAPIPKTHWVIEFDTEAGSIFSDKLTGWLSAIDMKNEIKLKFPSLSAAEEFAKENAIEYEVIEPNSKKLVKKTYADNFK